MLDQIHDTRGFQQCYDNIVGQKRNKYKQLPVSPIMEIQVTIEPNE